jgi:hypothetical protein
MFTVEPAGRRGVGHCARTGAGGCSPSSETVARDGKGGVTEHTIGLLGALAFVDEQHSGREHGGAAFRVMSASRSGE